MPPVSKAQRRFLFAKKPEVAKKWEAEGVMSPKVLPERAPKRPYTVNAHVRRGQSTKVK